MTTLLDRPQNTRTTIRTTVPTTPTLSRDRAGNPAEARQAQQDSSGSGQAPDREQSAQQQGTFTVSCDDWFKA
jgi:hypothetical protein